MLPVYFDIDDPRVLEQSVHRLMTGQSCTVHDLALDLRLPFPIVFQLLRTQQGPPAGLLSQVEFSGLTKFGILLDLLVSPDHAELAVTLAADLYDTREADRLFALMEAAVSRQPPTGEVGA